MPKQNTNLYKFYWQKLLKTGEITGCCWILLKTMIARKLALFQCVYLNLMFLNTYKYKIFKVILYFLL